MKSFFFRVYACIFSVFKLLGIKEDSVVFISVHNASFSDSFGSIEYQANLRLFSIYKLNRTDLNLSYKSFVGFIKSALRATSFFTKGAYRLARAKYVFLNDNFMPLAFVSFNRNTVVTQLWHGQGAFKKFGHDIAQTAKIRRMEKAVNEKLSYVICSSESVAPIYASAFNMPKNRVLPLGSPHADYFFNMQDADGIRQRFDTHYKNCIGKKLALYAPTFRDEMHLDQKLLTNIDVHRIKKALGEEYELLIRLHPQIRRSDIKIDRAVDVSDYDSVNELCLLCDLLITDYSSICMEFSIQNKPMVFYAFDLEDYESKRSFYFEYENYVPGKIAKTLDELEQALRNKDFEEWKNEEFKKINFRFLDNCSGERIAKFIF
ncbi:MAG: CDP-glycerol glycerophosphotransferase family protein [Oscillospiraceae bacterium]|jgi:CDP-ribitol ribitolphosphotransferase|nr:CDP-glycerol glycerophosphotransferase family protein [Oscillospiraceae bacterium]